MKPCDDCEGEGGFYTLAPDAVGPYPEEEWNECTTCGGIGWVCGIPAELSIDDLEELAWGAD